MKVPLMRNGFLQPSPEKGSMFISHSTLLRSCTVEVRVVHHAKSLKHGSDNSQPIFSRMLHRSHLNKGHLTMLLFEKISFDM